ncbi:hypothetical protein BH23DEI1_BH23DEI1_06150 [soil metagenome]|nr:hypothetical protein [Trueperaceae bacterium]
MFDRTRTKPRFRTCTIVVALLALGAVAVAQTERVDDVERRSARFMAEAIATTGWYALEPCPVTEVEERSDPGCARIPTELGTAIEWLDRLDEQVFDGTEREGAWQTARNLAYATWRLVVTGQRYLIVLAPHPTRAVTLLYVSELAEAP